MNSTRRAVLLSLAAGVIGALAPIAKEMADGGPANVTGVGGVGERLVRLFSEQNPDLLDRHFLAIADQADETANGIAVQAISRAPQNASGSLVILAGLGGHAGGELSYGLAREWAQSKGGSVDALFIVPFTWESRRRARAIDQANRFVGTFGSVALIDNQRWMTDPRETRREVFMRIDARVAREMDRMIAA